MQNFVPFVKEKNRYSITVVENKLLMHKLLKLSRLRCLCLCLVGKIFKKILSQKNFVVATISRGSNKFLGSNNYC